MIRILDKIGGDAPTDSADSLSYFLSYLAMLSFSLSSLAQISTASNLANSTTPLACSAAPPAVHPMALSIPKNDSIEPQRKGQLRDLCRACGASRELVALGVLGELVSLSPGLLD